MVGHSFVRASVHHRQRDRGVVGHHVRGVLVGAQPHLGQDQREGVVRSRFHGAEKVGERVALVGATRRALASREPAMADAAFLADARLVLEKQADFLVRMRISNRFQPVTEPP